MPRSWTTLFRRFRSSQAPQLGRRQLSRSSRNRSRAQTHLEQLEPRQVLAAQFVINEFLASNGAGLLDGFGERPDWVEIRNVGDAAGNLAGYHLTDDPNDLDKWTFPSTPLNAGAYLVVFASGKDTTDPQGRRHTNFSLSADGEYVALTDAALSVISEYGANGQNYPKQKVDVSYGNASNGNSRYMLLATAGAGNAQGFIGLVGDTSFSHDRGFYDQSFQLTISTNTPGAQIRYTLDGSTPTATTGLIYSTPITINKTTAVRAAAFRADLVPSNVDTQTYIFVDDVITQTFASTVAAGFPSMWGGTTPDYGLDSDIIGPNDLFGGEYAATIRDDLKALPTVSIVLNNNDMFGPSGIYSNPNNSGPGWDKPTSVEWINADGLEGFQENASIQIQGGAFRSHGLTRKKSFRVDFKERYGSPTLDFPLFGEGAVDEFDNFILRAENNDGWQWSSAGGKPLYSRDEFAALTQLEMGSTGVHGRHVHVYINGFYWGMYNIVERPDDAFSSRYLGGEKEEWDAINSGEAVEGNLNAWNTMIAMAQDVANAPDEVTRHAAYMKIQGLNPDGSDNPAFENYLNVDSLIDYMIVNIYTGNNDWPGHNWYTGRRRGPQSTGFHFYSWDAEWVLNLNSDVNTDKTGTSGSVTQPYALLRSSPEFRQRFADRAHNYFFNGGPLYVDPSNPNWDPTHPERNRPAARMVQLTNEIRDGIVGESARWGDQHGTNHHRGEWQNELNSLLTSYFPQRSAIVVNQLRNAGLYPTLTAPVYNQHGGQIAPGFDLRMNAPAGTIYYTLDGTDPRLADGTLSPTAIHYPATNTTTTFIPRNSSWKYLSNGSDQGTAWRNEGFNDTSWPSGNGQLGYGEQDEATVIPRGPAGGGADYITHYFRKTFTVTDAASITSLKVHLVRDDGAVVYINGQPATRSNMPEGEVNYLTPPLGSTGSPAENSYHELDVDPDLLHDGVNTIAVEVHEISSGNSDASFDLDLIAYTSSGAPPVILNQTTTVKSRTLEGANWSAMTEAYFNVHALADATNLKITEINYNPDVAGAGEPNLDNDEFEFLELMNVSAGTIDLRGVRFTAGIDFDFTTSGSSTLAPGERTLLVKNTVAFAGRYTGDYNIAGTFTGSLDNAGENLTLVALDDSFIANFTYDDTGAWPGRADGKGSTLEIISPTADGNLATSWRNSVEYNGTPGATGIGDINSIVVNEVLTHTDPPQVDAVEFHNPTGAAIDISGWYLSDDADNYQKYLIPNGTVIPAGGYLVLDESDFNPTPGMGTSFSFNSATGDDVYLVSATPAGKLANFIDHVDFPAAANGESFGRWPNATGKLYPMVSTTFGAANSGPRIGPVVISEIMYNHPSANDDLEYVELLNITDNPINLTNWKFDRGIDMTFGNVTIQPRSTLVVVRFDPNDPLNAAKVNTFRTTYGISAAVPLAGGYAGLLNGGVLDNGGETIRLARPDAPEPDMTIPYLLVDEVEYDDVAPWPTTPDGTGPSLTRINTQTVYGHEPTNWSGASATPGALPLPAPPSNLTAVSTAPNRIHLSWDDNSTDEVGFKVERLENSDWTVIATLGVNATSFDDTRLQSRRLYEYRVRAYHDAGDGLSTNVASAETQQLQQLTGTSGNDFYHLVRVGDQVRIYENEPPTGTPSYSSDLAQLSTNITLFTLAGNDTVNVSADPGMSLGSFIQWVPGTGANALNVTSGTTRFSIEMQPGDQLAANVSGGSHLTVWGFRETALTLVDAGSKVTIEPVSFDVSVLTSLSMDAGTTLDLTTSDLIIRATAGTKDAIHADAQAKIQSAQNGLDANLVTNWDGPGITSASARTSNVDTGFDLVGLGVIRNSDLDVTTGIPGSSYTSFGGVPVTADDVLLKYTYIGDANLNGLVSFDDYVGMDNAFFELIPNIGWATGDVTFDNAINFDDYSKVDQAFFFQGAPLAASSIEEAPGFAGGSDAEIEEAPGSAGGSSVGIAEESVGLRPTLQVVDIPAQIASSESESHSTAGPNLQAADSLADARLSVTRRSDSRDLWDDALLDVVGAY